MSRYIRLAWIAILGLALALRLSALGHIPLAPHEAMAAIASWDAAHGLGWPLTTASPLLLVGNSILFNLLGGGDGIARLIPALSGIVLVGMPFFWRRRLGDGGALVAAGLLLFSPLTLFAARQLEGTTPGVLGAALLLTVLMNDDEHPAWPAPLLIVGGVAIGLTGGPSFYDVLLAGLGAWLFYRWASNLPAWSSLRSWARPMVGGLMGALLISIGLGLRWNGWSGIAEGLAAWLSSWRAAHTGLPNLLLLFLYEPLTLFLVLISLIWATKKSDTFALALAIWGFVGLLLVSFRPGAAPSATLAAVVPLALLAGYGAQQICGEIPAPMFTRVGGHALVSFVFWQPVGLALAAHANGDSNVGFLGVPGSVNLIYLLGGITLLSLQALIALVFSLTPPLHFVWRGAILGIVLALLVTQIGFAWGLAFVRPTSPAEPAVRAASSPDLWALRKLLDEMAIQHGQRRDDFEITVATPDATTAAVIRWTLRDFHRLSVTAAWPMAPEGVLITTPDVKPPTTETVSRRGMAFAAISHGIAALPRCQAPLACPDLARWYLYRQIKDMPGPEKVILWRAP